MNLKYTLTNDNATVIHQGKTYVVRKGAPNFVPLRNALLNEDESAAISNLTAQKSLKEWARGNFTVDGNVISFKGTRLPEQLNKRIVEMSAKGESPEAFFAFWERLQRNPSYRSVQQLWNFLDHCGIPLTADGCFLAYKGVTSNLKDEYTKTLDNSPGAVHEMERNLVSDDPNTACHFGFHVGALEYAQKFSDRVVICKVDPEHVVCVPNDHSFQKMRVCKYTVQGFYGTQLSDTVHQDDEDLLDEDEQDGEEQSPDDLDSTGLLKLTLDQLRQYAYKKLKIVGATKIPGGKVGIVSRILEVRNGGSKDE